LARVINSLGVVFDLQDNPAKEAEALRLYEQALNLRKKLYEKKETTDPSIYIELSNNYRNLASVHQENGKYEEAMLFAKNAREIAEEAPIDENKNTALADSLNLIGLLNYFQGNYNVAEPLYQRAQLINKSARGADNPSVATNLHNLALLYFQQAKYKEAETHERAALGILRKAIFIDHDSVALSLTTLARIYGEVGKIRLAERYFEDGVDEMILAKGENGRRVGIIKHYQAELLLSQNQASRAEKIEEEVLAAFNKSLAPDHWYISRSESTLAGIKTQQKKYSEAESLYKKALPNLKVKLGPNHPEIATTLTGLAQLYITQGRNAEAEPLLKEALAIRERVEPNHPYLADVLETYSTLFQRTGREPQAKELSARAQGIRQNVRTAYEK
jgi:tetratricopeptide (TPR) repeat protein